MVHSNRKTNLVWIDLEMGGLDPDKNRITEIACIITNKNLEVIEEKEPIIINQPIETFNHEDEVIRKLFLETDFITKVKESKYNDTKAEKEVLDFIKEYVDVRCSPMFGNSIYYDRIFIMKYMKKLDAYLHYRLFDVSNLRNMAKMWYPDKVYVRNKTHRALDDIRESINELTHYRKVLIK